MTNANLTTLSGETARMAVTLEMAAAVSERGFVMQRAMPVVLATFDNGVNAGEVRIVGTKSKLALVKRNDGSSAAFAVKPEHLTVTPEVAEHLEIAMSYIFRFRELVARAAAQKDARRNPVTGRYAGHSCEPAGRK